MSLLYVTVRRARLVGNAAQFNCYVNLKLQNVKSTTISVKGNNPNWEQDFIFETSRMDIGLIIEVWNKGMIWDKLVGTQWMPLTRIKYSNEVEEGQWLSLDTELVMENGEVVGTKVPTGHSLLLEAHFELPCDLQDMEEEELMRKLELLNRIMDQEITSLREQRLNFSLNSGVSEDSDYTSDVSYPTGQHPSASVHHPNSSASQYGGVDELAHHAASEYTHDGDKPRYIEHESSYGDSMENNEYDGNYDQMDYNGEVVESDPLYYNSRPNYRTNSHSTERSRSTRSTSGYSNSQEYESDMQYSFEADRMETRNSQWNEESAIIDAEERRRIQSYSNAAGRRRSLERQTGFEQDHPPYFYPGSYNYNKSADSYPQDSFDSCQSYPENPVPPTWDKNGRYVSEPDKSSPYYPKQWSNETEPSKDADDWPKDSVQWNGEPYENNRLKEVTHTEWQKNDSTESNWPKSSFESNWPKSSMESSSGKDSVENEWNKTDLYEAQTEKLKDVHPSVVKPEWVDPGTKKEEPKKNGWVKEPSAEEWMPEQMSDQQIDNLISEWQDDIAQTEWLPEHESIEEKFEPAPAHVENGRNDKIIPDNGIKLDFSNHHLPSREPEFDDALVPNNKVDKHTENSRRPSVQSTTKPSLDQSVVSGETEVTTKTPEAPAPEFVLEGDPSWSTARRRWITAINKVVRQINELVIKSGVPRWYNGS